MLEKKQIHSFLKILQIPTDQSPEEIEIALKKAGWNSTDAREAVRVLNPDETGNKKTPITEPKLVAQVSAPTPPVMPPPPAPMTSPVVLASGPAPTTGSTHSVSIVPPPTEEEKKAAVAKLSPITLKPSATSQTAVSEGLTGRPFDALSMAQQVYRSDNYRLSPETITSLLGVDVDVSTDDIDILRHRRESTFTFTQLLVIVICSIAIAFAALFYGMYLFKVGPFHPTVHAFNF